MVQGSTLALALERLGEAMNAPRLGRVSYHLVEVHYPAKQKISRLVCVCTCIFMLPKTLIAQISPSFTCMKIIIPVPQPDQDAQ